MILKTTSSLFQKRMVLELLATSAHLLQDIYRTKMASQAIRVMKPTSQDGVDFPIESQAIDESGQPHSRQCAYVSHFNNEIENLKKELLDLRLLVSSSSLRSTPTSDSVEMLNKLKHENDLLRLELISQKEQCKSLSEERDSLKLVVQLLSKDLYKSKLTDAPPPSQEKSDTGTDMAVKVNFPPPKVTHHTTNPPHSPDIPGETTVILGDSIIQNLW